MSTTADVLGHHLGAFGSGNLDELLSDYTAESKIITPDGVIDSLDGIRAMFTAMLEEFGKPGMSFEMTAQHVVGDVAFIAWKAETADNVYELGTDTLVVRDGKIVSQTVVTKATPKG